jgi:GAF domain-containing protein/sensor histidine kinase YesM
MTDHAAPLQAEASAAAVPRKVRSRLFLKYAGLFVAVVCLALVTNGVFEIWVSYREHKDGLIQIQHEQAESAAAKIGQFIKEIESQVGWTTQLLWSAGTIEQRRFDALRLLRQVPAITELAQVDASGKEQLRVSRLAMDVVGSGLDLSKEPKFTDAVKSKVYYGPVYFRRDSEPYMTLSLAGTRRDAGVSIAEVNLKLIWDVVSKIKVGQHGDAYVVDRQGRLIAHPDISLVLRKTDMTRLAQVQAARQHETGAAAQEVETATDIQGRQVLTAYAPVEPLGWTVFVELPVAEAYEPLIASLQRTALVLFGALFLAALAGIFLARRMMVPIQALRTGAARIAGGDLTQRISVKTGDELEALADQFNDMTGRLQESYADLELKVEVRTAELSESLDQQTATSEVLRVISSSPGDLQPVFEAMLENAVRICEAKFGNLFLYEKKSFRIVAQQNPPPAYAERWRQEPVLLVDDNSQNPLATLAATRDVVHIADLATEPGYVKREPRMVSLVESAGARTHLLVPMLKEGEMIGAISIYRQEVRPFGDKQIEVVQNFAAQAVIAIENTRLLKELRESLQQQTATADVLKVISGSPGELEPVFQAMLENATRICGAKFGTLYLYDGDSFHATAFHNAPPAFIEDRKRAPLHPGPHTSLGLAARTKQVAQIVDITKWESYLQHDPFAVAGADLGGYRTVVSVPMLKEDKLIGVISVYRQEVRSFTDKQIELVQNFAAQAVIAIENARLLNELRESLEQQTATADVLKVISSSPGDLEPVFEAMLANATRICDAKFGHLFLSEGDDFRVVALQSVSLTYPDWLKRGSKLVPSDNPHGPLAQLARAKKIVHITDLAAEQAYIERNARMIALVESSGARTFLGVPMFKEGTLVGAIAIYRQEVRPFSDKQIELMTNFAAQAVIAIENTRLLNELRQRTDDLSESLEQQTATAEVLKVISSSSGELQPVFEAMLENATRLCAAKFGNLYLCEGDAFRTTAMHNVPPAFAEARRREPLIQPRPGSLLGRIRSTMEAVHVPEVTADQGYIERHPLFVSAVELGGFRSLLAVPMLKDGNLIGAIVIYRQEPGSFTDKQIELVKNFAAQAVIAIENTRLLNELRESLEQQTATSEVLGVISSSPGELQPVFETMLTNATKICQASYGALWLCEGDAFRSAALYGALPAAWLEQWRTGTLFHVRPETPAAITIKTRQPVHTADLSASDAYRGGEPLVVTGVDIAGIRTMINVPLFKEKEPVGVISIYRREVRPFSDKQIELVTNFAAQAVIAIENTRLLNELRQRTDDLSESLEQQTATSEILNVIAGSPTDVQPVFDAIAESALRLFGAQSATVTRVVGDMVHLAALTGGSEDGIKAVQSSFPSPASSSGIHSRVVSTGEPTFRTDIENDPDVSPAVKELARARGYRSILVVPMLRKGVAIGTIGVTRRDPGEFADHHIDLLRTFADQAVIAIENVRLFDDVQKRTEDLSESLQQQTATADVLKVISRSAFDLQPVLDTIVETAARLCDAEFAVIFRLHDGKYHYVAANNADDAFLKHAAQNPIAAERGSLIGRTALEQRTIHLPDCLADPEYTYLEYQSLGNYRSMLGVPLLREGMPIGVIGLMRTVVMPFTEKQIELVTTFADQAVIAIENVRLFDEIQDKSRQLAEASKHKSQFLANMSHELRTPMNAILGYTELILDNIYGEPTEKMRGVLTRVQSNGKHLLGLINDVLDLSKIEAGQLTLSLADYSVKDIVHSVFSSVESLARNKKLELKIELPQKLPAAHGDERRLTQVLLNLVGNSIKFTDKGEVAIKAEAANGSFTISVRDTGPGIAEADQRKIFEEFQQADSSTTKEKGGTGLGLAISKRIVEMHGGRLWVESSLGHGSTFSFSIPLNVERQVEPA